MIEVPVGKLNQKNFAKYTSSLSGCNPPRKTSNGGGKMAEAVAEKPVKPPAV